MICEPEDNRSIVRIGPGRKERDDKEAAMNVIANEPIEQDERSLIWTFCQAADILYEQFYRLEQTGTLSHSLLSSLVGEPSQKGLLWYLKDKAHTLFGDNEQRNSPGALLNWSLGYIFHECVKLMEDTRLQQVYVARFDDLTSVYPQHSKFFYEIEKQTRRSVALESNRLTMLIQVSIDLFTEYFAGRGDHRPLARLLFDQEESFRRVFGERYSSFVHSVYGDSVCRLYIEAGYSLLEAGKFDKARVALQRTSEFPDCEEARAFEQLYREALQSDR